MCSPTGSPESEPNWAAVSSESVRGLYYATANQLVVQPQAKEGLAALTTSLKENLRVEHSLLVQLVDPFNKDITGREAAHRKAWWEKANSAMAQPQGEDYRLSEFLFFLIFT